MSIEHSGRVKVFVYGTLRYALSNYHVLKDPVFVREDYASGLDLYPRTDGCYPFAIEGEGRVKGELYLLKSEDIPALDDFEGVPNHYIRKEKQLESGESAQIYLHGDLDSLLELERNGYVQKFPEGDWVLYLDQKSLLYDNVKEMRREKGLS
ncbi:unnamed protein product [Blepharisma stoltei]|uniref:Gamma-glutamylcyclotransferase AIG2-like domain-containing protein n=1 Tax=Blepharisma stoltei TaxID=1481888 RepID=A0AAU9J0W1_9CILI|nr:unnamed protein product [Blepharisma stoltei]